MPGRAMPRSRGSVCDVNRGFGSRRLDDRIHTHREARGIRSPFKPRAPLAA